MSDRPNSSRPWLRLTRKSPRLSVSSPASFRSFARTRIVHANSRYEYPPENPLYASAATIASTIARHTVSFRRILHRDTNNAAPPWGRHSCLPIGWEQDAQHLPAHHPAFNWAAKCTHLPPAPLDRTGPKPLPKNF